MKSQPTIDMTCMQGDIQCHGQLAVVMLCFTILAERVDCVKPGSSRIHNSANDESTQALSPYTTDSTKLSLTLNNNTYNSHINLIVSGHTKNAGAPWHYRDLMDYCVITVTLLGCTVNVFTCITFVCNGTIFNEQIRVLLQHQCLVDALVCALALLFLLQKPMWTTGTPCLDTFICLFWHNQIPYWAALLISVWNLVFIAFERYTSICSPLRHNKYTKKKIILTILVMYIWSIFSLVPALFQTKLVDGECVYENLLPGQLMTDCLIVYGVYWFIVAYLIPVIMLIVLYGRLLHALHKRKLNKTLGFAPLVDQASSQLTRTAVIVAGFFFISFSLDTWYYLLGKVNVVVYQYELFLARLGLLLTVLNSCANPFLYALSMPIFRISVKKTLCFCGNFTPSFITSSYTKHIKAKCCCTSGKHN